MTAEIMRESFARVGDGFVCRETELMRAGGIAVNLLGGFEPSLAGLAHDGRGGVVVKVKHRQTG